MSDEIKFPKGIMVKKPHPNAPDFVKAKVSIKVKEMIEWLQEQTEEWINLDQKESKEGKFYFSVDDWKPNTSGQPQDPGPGAGDVLDDNSDLPF